MPRLPRHIIAVVLFVSIVAPLHVLGEEDRVRPRQQEFIITAYYSPLPEQCCYVLGGEAADKRMNGEGIAGADGTPVHPGMAAGPATYAFGTRISLPGIGTVTVNDRGGAITELPEGPHRLDLWVGHGEEGLARALAFGVQRVTATVFAPGTQQPEEHLVLAELPAPAERLEDYQVADGLLDVRPKKGDRGLSVRLLQEVLTEVGHPVTTSDVYDDATVAALKSFLGAMNVNEPADHLTDVGASYLLAAQATRKDPTIPHVDDGSSVADVQHAQRLLRFIGFYKGRTDGKYDGATAQAILAFQQNKGLVGDATSPGAGRIGPLTKGKLSEAWFRRTVARRAQRYLLLASVAKRIDATADLPARYLQQDMTGDDVRRLQEALADAGYFYHDAVNGVFGPMTKSAVLRFQLDRKLVANASDPAAGYVGPGTLRTLRTDALRKAYLLVRANGVGVL